MEEKKKIVIAEDSPSLCEVLKDILEREGYEIHIVHEGYSLISFLQQNQDTDAILLDLFMPDKSGLSVFNTVRSVAPATKLIIYTGYSSYKNSVFAKEADAFVDKAEGAEKLINTIKSLIG
ncbi:MAG: response regulator [Candidatus Omnitrophica bacterium]|nr:response regulator [Candidatus Omnitrophota bacterium]MDD5488253.1 response regulator [Candidatus Omnitrophota bacterium]